MQNLIGPVYLKLTNNPVVETLDVNDREEVFVDLDVDGNIVGVEVLGNCVLQYRIPNPPVKHGQ